MAQGGGGWFRWVEKDIPHPQCPPSLPLSPPSQATCRCCQLSGPRPSQQGKGPLIGLVGGRERREHKERALLLKLPLAHESLRESHPVPFKKGSLSGQTHSPTQITAPFPRASSPWAGSSISNGEGDTMGLGLRTLDGGKKKGSPWLETPGSVKKHRHTHTRTHLRTHRHAHTHALILNKIPFAYNLKINKQLILI